MSLYYVLIPSSEPEPTFTRYGGLTKNLLTATKTAIERCGRVYETDGCQTKLVMDKYEPPAITSKPLKARDYRQALAIAQIWQ